MMIYLHSQLFLKTDEVPEGWRDHAGPKEDLRDEPEEVRRARTTGGTFHHTSQVKKDNNVPKGWKKQTRPYMV
jgi:hypothetical protein